MKKPKSCPSDTNYIVDRLAAIAPKIMAAEAESLGRADNALTGWDAAATINVLKTFVDEHFEGRPHEFRNEEILIKLLQRVLSVDLSSPANRRGAIPKALGLASRAGAQKRVQQRGFYKLMDTARFGLGQRLTIEDSAVAVKSALARMGVDIEEDTLKKIYQRWDGNAWEGPPTT